METAIDSGRGFGTMAVVGSRRLRCEFGRCVRRIAPEMNVATEIGGTSDAFLEIVWRYER